VRLPPPCTARVIHVNLQYSQVLHIQGVQETWPLMEELHLDLTRRYPINSDAGMRGTFPEEERQNLVRCAHLRRIVLYHERTPPVTYEPRAGVWVASYSKTALMMEMRLILENSNLVLIMDERDRRRDVYWDELA